jgi:zinc transport system substrate-binding protein
MDNRAFLGVLMAVVVATTAGCGDDRGGAADATGPPLSVPVPDLTVAVAFYPLEEIVRNVGQARVGVIDLTPGGTEPHDLSLSARQVTDLERADAVFYLGRGFQPGVEKAVTALPDTVTKVDLLATLSLLPVTPQLSGTSGEVDGEVLEGDVDPHVWLDPSNMSQMAEVVRATLTDLHASGSADFALHAGLYQTQMSELSTHYSTKLADCQSRTIVTSHRAFEYLARRYGLEQVPIAGISPEEEPDPQSLEAVARAAEAAGATVVFFEEQVPKALSETVASEIGATTDSLDPVETITQDQLDAGEGYTSIMESNLAHLVDALRCR